MKKILLLFVLGFGLSSAVYASSEIQSVIEITPIFSSTSDSPELPDWIEVRFADGTTVCLDDGNDCTFYIDLADNGVWAFNGSFC